MQSCIPKVRPSNTRALRAVILCLLTEPQLCIAAIARQQFVMGALFNNLTFFKHNNAVGVRNRAEAVRDGQNRAPLPGAVQRVLNLIFRFAVQRVEKMDSLALSSQSAYQNS